MRLVERSEHSVGPLRDILASDRPHGDVRDACQVVSNGAWEFDAEICTLTLFTVDGRKTLCCCC